MSSYGSRRPSASPSVIMDFENQQIAPTHKKYSNPHKTSLEVPTLKNNEQKHSLVVPQIRLTVFDGNNDSERVLMNGGSSRRLHGSKKFSSATNLCSNDTSLF